MVTRKNIFQGDVQIYLQGQNALIPVGEIREDQMTYYIGSKKSKLLIRDHRRNPILAAHRALAGLDGIQFADIFNEPAYIEVAISEGSGDAEKIEISLHPTIEKNDSPVLWIGVLDEKRIPPYEIDWEFLRPLNQNQIAFAMLAK